MLKEIRALVVERLNAPFQAQFPGVKLVFDNAPFDWNALPERFVTCELKFYGGNQIGAQAEPRTRYTGYVYITAYAREGTGSSACLDMVEWLGSQLAYVVLSNSTAKVVMKEAEPVGSDTEKGWYLEQLKVPFFADPVVP